MRRVASGTLLALLLTPSATSKAHDIPNARVDRSIQVTLGPSKLAIDYEVSLAELTLTQELRSLIGGLPGADRREWFGRYGEETGPLNARGLLVSVSGTPLPLRSRGFSLVVESHPRYTFHFEADLPPSGRLEVRDTNFASSEGTSRLAIRGLDGVTIRGDDLPSDVEEIEPRPVWLLSDDEERRTKELAVDYESPGVSPFLPPISPDPVASAAPTDPIPRPAASSPAAGERISRLLDGRSGLPLAALWLMAFSLGAAHAVQPGHGKTLVAAAVVGERGHWTKGAVLASVTTLTHMAVVLAVAGVLWRTGSEDFGAIHLPLARLAGFAIAALGLWRVGRHLGGFGEHESHEPEAPASRGVIGLGVAGGLVPCWDAIGLIVLANALGRLAQGVLLLFAFSLGMALVLIAVGAAASRLRRLAGARGLLARPERPLGIASGLMLAAIGLFLLAS